MHSCYYVMLRPRCIRRTVTHSIDTDQRRIPLAPNLVSSSPGAYQWSLAMPGNPGISLPGIWMLFAVGASGTPSVSWTIRVTPS